jgi:dipeptidase
MLVGKKASVDGSVMVTHSMDEANNDFRLVYVPAKTHPLASQRPVYHDHEIYPRLVSADVSPSYAPRPDEPQFPVSKPIGSIPQVNHTYGFLDLSYGALNEHQLAIGESTCSARTVGKPGDGSPGSGTALFWVGPILLHVKPPAASADPCPA